ncbi:MAG: MiaB/RimO family radical SAM methylthiotransferase [Gemmatimonadota bacterium]
MSDLHIVQRSPEHSVWLYTFGCKANQYDTERMRQELESRGARISVRVEDASTAVLNTCTVTSSADASARRLVRKLHRRHPNLNVVVAGCSSALRAGEYRDMAGVTGVVEGHDPVAVAAAVAPEAALARADEEPIGGVLLRSNRRGARGWLKIQDGCDRKCSFCATRLARGASRSRPKREIIAEARLQARVHAELVLTGIHIGHYGRDLWSPSTLSALCAEILDAVPEIRLRLGSIEATEIDDDLVALLAASGGRMAPHLHIPMQSGSDAVLRRMRRWHTRDAYRRRVLEIAEVVNPLGLGADVIAGFPGETQADHERTRALIEDLPFTYLHVFPWSPRDGTAAATLSGRVARPLAARRARDLRDLGVEKGRAYTARRVGGTARVAIETPNTGLTGDYLRVELAGGSADWRPGTLVSVLLRGAVEGGLRAGTTGRAALPVLTASA